MWQSMEQLVCGLETSPLARRKMSIWWEISQQFLSGHNTSPFSQFYIGFFFMTSVGCDEHEYHRPWISVYHGRGGQVEAGSFVICLYKLSLNVCLLTPRWYASTCHWTPRVYKKASTCWRAGGQLERLCSTWLNRRGCMCLQLWFWLDSSQIWLNVQKHSKQPPLFTDFSVANFSNLFQFLEISLCMSPLSTKKWLR